MIAKLIKLAKYYILKRKTKWNHLGYFLIPKRRGYVDGGGTTLIVYVMSKSSLLALKVCLPGPRLSRL